MPILGRKDKVPLGIYIHVPFCRSKCQYCDFYSVTTKDDKMLDGYIDAMCAHIKEAGSLAPAYKVDTVYFGGGTPSFFGADGMATILTAVRRSFDVTADAEITFEANPDSVSDKLLRRLRGEGHDRRASDEHIPGHRGKIHDAKQPEPAETARAKIGPRSAIDDRLHLFQRPAAVGDGILLVGGKFGERPLVPVGNEKRVVAEALGTRRSFGDTAETLSHGFVFRAARVDERDRAGEVGGAVLGPFEILEQQRIVARSVGRLARIPRAAHAGRAAERLYLQARIVRHAPFAGMTRGDRAHLDKCVADEIVSVLLNSFGIVGNDFKGRKNRGNLPDFVGIVRGDKKFHTR